MAAKRKQKGGRAGRPSGPFETLRKLRDELQEARPKLPASAAPRRTDPERSTDDALDFHRLIAGVKPLDKASRRVPKIRVARSEGAERAAERLRQSAVEADAVHARLLGLVDTAARFEVADDGRRVEGRRIDLPVDVLRRLRRGLFPIDGRLDLHGMSVQEARGQLELFLRTMRARSERCVLVIHGKGEHSPQGLAVLRGEIAAWLSQGPSCQHVAGFASARDHDGGDGAVYILLRR
jgi:DNA-nicking Smr family endonuclease